MFSHVHKVTSPSPPQAVPAALCISYSIPPPPCLPTPSSLPPQIKQRERCAQKHVKRKVGVGGVAQKPRTLRTQLSPLALGAGDDSYILLALGFVVAYPPRPGLRCRSYRSPPLPASVSVSS